MSACAKWTLQIGTLWLVVLVWLLAAPLLPQVPVGLAESLTFTQSWLQIEGETEPEAGAKQEAGLRELAKPTLGATTASLPDTPGDTRLAVHELQSKRNLVLPSWRRSASLRSS